MLSVCSGFDLDLRFVLDFLRTVLHQREQCESVRFERYCDGGPTLGTFACAGFVLRPGAQLRGTERTPLAAALSQMIESEQAVGRGLEPSRALAQVAL